MALFLHEQGYTCFTIPKLTYLEIESLVESYNRKMKKRAVEQKRMERKSKMKRGRYK